MLASLVLLTGQAHAESPRSAAPAPPAPSSSAAKPGQTLPPEYYVEPSAAPDAAAASSTTPSGAPGPRGSATPPPLSAAPPSPPPGTPPAAPSDPEEGPIYDPPPPGFYPPGVVEFEPPPPPEPHHVAPRTSLWLGARVGWFIPFGSAWSRALRDDNGNVVYDRVPWRDFVGSGPVFELDAGARLSRNYNVFALWERAQLGSGRGDSGAANALGKPDHGSSDFYGVGIRATSDPDRVGFVTELAIGYRRARVEYPDGTELQFTDAPFEARLGLGAEIRVNRWFSLSPLLSLGVGSYGKIERVTKDGIVDERTTFDESDGHAWATLTLGGSFDLLASQR